MSSIVVAGDTSGACTITAPAVAGTPTLTLPTTSGTLYVKAGGGAIGVADGGTGQTSYTDGQLLIGNTTGNTLTKATLTAGSGISITNGAGSITIASSGGSGTVTSVATGNGLSGGTITTSGTLSIACPTFNTVGSYCLGYTTVGNSSLSSGSNYSAGGGQFQMRSASLFNDYNNSGLMSFNITANLSGTWKWMGANGGSFADYPLGGLICRVS